MDLIDFWEKDTFGPLDYFRSQTVYLSEEHVSIDWNPQAVCPLIRGPCLLFSDKLSLCRAIKAYLITLLDVTFKHERSDWQLFLWLVFPFMEGTSFHGLSIYGTR